MAAKHTTSNFTIRTCDDWVCLIVDHTSFGTLVIIFHPSSLFSGMPRGRRCRMQGRSPRRRNLQRQILYGACQMRYSFQSTRHRRQATDGHLDLFRQYLDVCRHCLHRFVYSPHLMPIEPREFTVYGNI